MVPYAPMLQTRYYARGIRAFRVHIDEHRFMTADEWVHDKGIVETDPITVIRAAREISEGQYQFLVARCETIGFLPRLLFPFWGWVTSRLFQKH